MIHNASSLGTSASLQKKKCFHVSKSTGTVGDGKDLLLMFPRTVFALEVGYRVDEDGFRTPFQSADTLMV